MYNKDSWKLLSLSSKKIVKTLKKKKNPLHPNFQVPRVRNGAKKKKKKKTTPSKSTKHTQDARE